MKAQVGRAINLGLTLRNWTIGFYVCEYEQRGSDRAAYREKLIERLAERLRTTGMERAEARELRRYRRLYQVYPGLGDAMPRGWKALLPQPGKRSHRKREAPTPESPTDPREMITKLSFTHLAELISIDDPQRRSFYEAECIRGNWSVRELRRQISSLYYERTGLSKNKALLANRVRRNPERADLANAIRDPYVFEFLGLEPREVMHESTLEAALLERLREFLLELGHGFCFEARQKRILIGETHCFVDLVFYHRVLKCHVLIELKADEFRHEHLGQLNTYVSWFARNVSTEGDNPPIGLLLCTRKDNSLVEYALAGMDNRIFVSKYQVALPGEAVLRRFVDAERRALEAGR